MNKVDSFHSYLQATKDMAQSVVHRYHTCDEEPDVVWEIIENIMEGLIAVFLDMFYDGKGEPLDKDWVEFAGRKVPTMKVSPYLTESDVEKDIEHGVEIEDFESINKRLDAFEQITVTKMMERWESLAHKVEALEAKQADSIPIAFIDAKIKDMTEKAKELTDTIEQTRKMIDTYELQLLNARAVAEGGVDNEQ